jgi:multiple sugar transport system ATP-binding protein
LIAKRNGEVRAVLAGEGGQSLAVPDSFARSAADGQPVKLGIRPEIMSVRTDNARDVLECAIELVEPLGAEALLHGKTDGQSFIAKEETLYSNHELNAVSRLGVDSSRIHIFDAATGRTLKAEV